MGDVIECRSKCSDVTLDRGLNYAIYGNNIENMSHPGFEPHLYDNDYTCVFNLRT